MRNRSDAPQVPRTTRRRLLSTAGALALAGLAGCATGARPRLRMDRGVGVLHPAVDRYLATGLRTDGDRDLFATATDDPASDVVGPDASASIADALDRPGEDVFHVVAQLRSSPDAPRALRLALTDTFEWPDRRTLRASVAVEPWGSLDRVDDAETRAALRAADELRYTVVWTLTPAPDRLPADVTLAPT